ncbi:MAG: glutaminyl-peptide cyclotransferase [Nevskiaceae bacterium]
MSKYQLSPPDRATNFVPVVRACAIFAAVAVGVACANERVVTLPYEIVATHPHDAAGFTQGLHWHEGRIVESVGGHGRSALLLREVRDSTPLARRALAKALFGEGVSGDGRRFVQLTWRSGVALIYDLALHPIGRYTYEGEGWGLAWDGARWLMSDGSSRIVARDRDSFAPQGGFDVTDRGRPVAQLNELEFARGRLYANVWHSDRIAVIDPGNGRVEAWIDLVALRKGFVKPPGWNEREDVLNGIAFDPRSGHFFVTGKRWPVLYEIRLAGAAP